MYNAPAVTFPVGRSRMGWALTVGVLLLAAGVLGFWCHQVQALAWPQGLGVAVWFIVAAFALHDALHVFGGTLVWDGQNWHWESEGRSVAVTVQAQWDGQTWLLVALRLPGRRKRWLWLARDQDVLHWEALRRALWGQGGTDGRQQGLGLDPT